MSVNIGECQGLMKWMYENPRLTNWIFIVMTSLLAGITGCVGVVLSLTIRKRQIVYALWLMLWFIPCIWKDSLMNLMQPFTEYGIRVMVKGFIFFVIFNVGVCALIVLRGGLYCKKTDM